VGTNKLCLGDDYGRSANANANARTNTDARANTDKYAYTNSHWRPDAYGCSNIAVGNIHSRANAYPGLYRARFSLYLSWRNGVWKLGLGRKQCCVVVIFALHAEFWRGYIAIGWYHVYSNLHAFCARQRANNKYHERYCRWSVVKLI
jgi:hypothetical protein